MTPMVVILSTVVMLFALRELGWIQTEGATPRYAIAVSVIVIVLGLLAPVVIGVTHATTQQMSAMSHVTQMVQK